jgi:putative PIN family toxin of toxin-antitoxin system
MMSPHLNPSPVVLDTNTILALWMFVDPKLARLRAWAEDAQRTTLYASPASLAELERVLAYPQFKQSEAEQTLLLAQYQARTVVASPLPSTLLPKCRDRDDQKFLELAVATSRWLLTRDRDLLRLARRAEKDFAVTIISPENFQQHFLPLD